VRARRGEIAREGDGRRIGLQHGTPGAIERARLARVERLVGRPSRGADQVEDALGIAMKRHRRLTQVAPRR